MKTTSVILFIIFLLNYCSNSQNIKIVPLTMLTVIDSSKNNGVQSAYRVDYFMVDCTTVNIKKIRKAIDNYIKSQPDSLRKNYFDYNMNFYKKSENVNMENILSFPANLRYKSVLHDKE